MMRCFRRTALPTLLCLFAAAGCSDAGAPRGPARIGVVSGAGQPAVVLRVLPAPVVVEVSDEDGRPLAGATVTWTVAEGSGTLAAETSTTDRTGRAQVTWTLGARAGTAELTATVGSVAPLAITATAYADAPATLSAAGGDAQAGLMGQPLGEPVAVDVKDAHGNPVPWVPVTFTPATDHGTVSSGVVLTNADGRARAVWTVGRMQGPQLLTASIPNVAAPVQFTATVAPDYVATLQVTIDGLPAAVAADVVVRNASGYSRTITVTGSVELPAAGEYTVEAREAIGGGLAFDAVEPVQTVMVQDGDARAAEVDYALEVTDVASDVPVTGIAAPAELLRYFRIQVPEGASSLTVSTTGDNGDVDLLVRRDTARTLTGVSCTSQNFDSNDACTVSRPAAGTYYIHLHAYRSYTNVTLRATYIPGGSLRLAATGLPGDATPSFTISGAQGFSEVVTANTTVTGLLPGRYEIRADSVEAGGRVYAPSPAQQQVDVAVGATSTVTATYVATSGGFNLSIAGMHVTQATQTMDGAVPLVAGRAGLLRVFVRGSLVNTVAPDVRVRIYRGGAPVDSIDLTAPARSTPVTGDGAELLSTWNYILPAALVQPGLAMVAEVDPTDAVRESDEGDNVFPASGAPRDFDVRAAAPFAVRLVPVLQADGLLGDATEANRDSWIDMVRAVYPLAEVDVDVRAPYSFGGTLAPSGPAWPQLLQEIAALRAVDGSTRHYYGAVKLAYGQGAAGIGQIGGAAAVGADWPGGRASVAAHEWGHNFGRRHAPCGGAAGADPDYPYEGGRPGTHGWDMRTGIIRPSDTHFDLMSYCGPTWVSDYTYRAVMDYRAAAPGQTSAAVPALLVWGRITADGTVILEPAFEVTAPPLLPERAGRFRLEVSDAGGRSLPGLSFDGVEVDHTQGERHFAWTIPLSRFGGRAPAMLRVSGAGTEAVRRSRPAPAGAGVTVDDVKATRMSDGRMRLQWDVAASAVVLVQDAHSGQVLSFARGGDQLVALPGTAVDLTLTDGVVSRTRRLDVPR